jgi:hypothetical protein
MVNRHFAMAAVSASALGWCLLGCGGLGFDIESYKNAVRSGFDLIPESVEMEQKLGECDHFIQGDGKLWNSEVHFGGRYVLSMQVPIEVNLQFSRVNRVTGEPRFYFFEVERVFVDGGNMGADFRGASQREFGTEEWRAIVDGGMDFRVIGITIHPEPVPRFEEYVAAAQAPRVQVRPAD